MEKEKKLELVEYLSSFTTEDRIDKIEEVLKYRTRHVTIVLEDLYQQHNASAVLRSCDCFGIQDIHIIENSNDFNPSSGVTIGAHRWLTLYRYDQEGINNTEACFRQLREKNYTLAATTPHSGDKMIGDWPVEEKTALIFGTEKEGLSDYALKQADQHIRIPIFGFSESYNISVSAALCLYDLMLRIHKSGLSWRLTEDEILDLRLDWLKKSIRASDQLERRFLEKNTD